MRTHELTLGVVLQELFVLFIFETGSLTGLELTEWVKLTGRPMNLRDLRIFNFRHSGGKLSSPFLAFLCRL